MYYHTKNEVSMSTSSKVIAPPAHTHFLIDVQNRLHFVFAYFELHVFYKPEMKITTTCSFNVILGKT